jgi:hypothetical protein
MRPFCDRHPHLRAPPGVMTCEEIRYWIRELRFNRGWRPVALSNTLGAYDSSTLMGKLKGKWIYPGEHIRFSRQLDRIISGELVPDGVRARVAEHPKPLQASVRMKFDLASGRLGYVQPRVGVVPKLPSFREALSGRSA